MFMAVFKGSYFMHDIMIVFIPCLLDIIDVDAFMNIPGVINSNFEIIRKWTDFVFVDWTVFNKNA